MPFLPPPSHGRAYHSRHKSPAQHFRQNAPSVSSRDYPADSGLDLTQQAGRIIRDLALDYNTVRGLSERFDQLALNRARNPLILSAEQVGVNQYVSATET